MSVFVVSSSHYRYSCYLSVNSGFFSSWNHHNQWKQMAGVWRTVLFVLIRCSFLNSVVSWLLVELSLERILTTISHLHPVLSVNISALQVLQAWLLSDAMYVTHPWRQVNVLTILFFFKWQKSRNTEEAPQSKHLELWWKRKHTYYSVMKTLIGNVPTCRLRDTKMFQNNILLSNMIYKNHSSQSSRQNYMHKVIWIHFELSVRN